jgi:chemotaxis protein CheX
LLPLNVDMGGQLTDAIQQTVETVWMTLLGIAAQRISAAASSSEVDRAWAGAVCISGAWDGEVRLHCSSELAHRAAAILFATSREQTSTAQAEDALRELANVTGGNLMEVLPGPSQLSMPSVSNGGLPLQPGSIMLSRLHFDCEGEPLSVVVVRRVSTN